MAARIGIDLGSTSVKLAVLGEPGDAGTLARIAAASQSFFQPSRPIRDEQGVELPLLVSRYRRIHGHPVPVTAELVAELVEALGVDAIAGVRVTGSGGRLTSRLLAVPFENEFKAISRAVERVCPEVRTVFEMGGENSKYLLFESAAEGRLGIRDYGANGDCAAGTGSFIDQQASRLEYKVEEVGDVALSSGKSAQIAGRCSVFAKSDMIHAQQKGFRPEAILKGLCDAVARNFKGTIVKGRTVEPRAAFIGGLAWNKGVHRALEEAFGMEPGDLLVPELHAWFVAIGTALLEREQPGERVRPKFEDLTSYTGSGSDRGVMEPLSMDRVVLQRDQAATVSLPDDDEPVAAFLGIDIGSVSTNLVVIDGAGRVIREIYLWTRGRPIEAVDEGLKEIQRELGKRVEIRGVGTTGSGRELVGELVGADTINDEITAHKTGAMHISLELLGEQVDTIFEIGGQDSKYISISDGVVVDFTMNEACAAGTGSFLEEQAEKLGVQIKGEFAELALGSTQPLRLGERCTVFMEKEVNALKLAGSSTPDIAAGLAYSIVANYLNRVVRGRKVGEVVFFQGGTAYNDSVAAAFAETLGKRIVVPPHNGVMGAIGAALIAKEKIEYTKLDTRFRGFDLGDVDYAIREFTCKGCSNTCDMQEVKVEGQKTFWGDKCSEKYRRPAKVEREPVIPDLLALRRELLLDGYSEEDDGRSTVGFPQAMYTFENFPFWSAYFNAVGLRPVLSSETNKLITAKSLEATVAEPCHPVRIAHGHAHDCIEKGTDWIFIPNVIDAEVTDVKTEKSFLCPWGQSLAYVVKSAPLLRAHAEKFLIPTVHFSFGREFVTKEIGTYMRERLKVGRRQNARAMEAAFAAQNRFKRRCKEAGREALDKLAAEGVPGVVLVGRPYNVCDPQLNMNVGLKLRDYYGVNVIPMDFLPHEGITIDDVNPNMYWNYGIKIVQASRLTESLPDLHVVYVTNFKCGPDSYIKHFAAEAAGKPFLTLQFDGHSNDAGMITRCEAYLDSKGLLRWWKTEPQHQST